MKITKGTHLLEFSNSELFNIACLLKVNLIKHIESYDKKHIKMENKLITDNELINNKFDMMINMFYISGHINYADDVRIEFQNLVEKRLKE